MGSFKGKSIINDMKLDSLELVQLMTMIEEKLNFDISDIEGFIDIMQEYDTLSAWIEGAL